MFFAETFDSPFGLDSSSITQCENRWSDEIGIKSERYEEHELGQGDDGWNLFFSYENSRE